MNDELKTKEENNNSGASETENQPTPSAAPAAKLAGGLPGLGSKPPGSGLPGLGSKPPGGGLPGLGSVPPAGGGLPGLGTKPAGGGLPGLGAQPAGGGLPGIGAKPGGIPGAGGAAAGGAVPDFIKKQQEEERQKEISRDPFASSALPQQATPSFIPPAAEDIVDTGAALPDANVGKSSKPLIIIAAVIGLVCIGIGYGGGLAVNQRGMLNKVLRDAWIIQYEMNKLRELHGELQGMVGAALADAKQKKFHKAHVEFLAQKVNGNPFNSRLFTERNYKTLNPMVVQMMANLFRNWDNLATLIAEHRSATNMDEKALTVAGDEFQKLLKANYGVIFERDKNANGQFSANVVLLGAQTDDGIQIQNKAGTFAGTRKLYNPSEPDSKLTEEPGEYVVAVGARSKKTILQNATQSHFNAYATRLEEMAKLLKIMEEEQTNMFGPLDDNCSREPVSFLARGIDPEAEFEEYKANAEGGSKE